MADAHDAAVVMAWGIILLLERAETAAVRVNSVVGTVRNEDDDEHSLACLEEANQHHLMQSVNRSIS
jgi:hypothetical protein